MLATKLLPAMETDEAGMLQAHRLAAGSADLGAQIADLTVSWPRAVWRCVGQPAREEDGLVHAHARTGISGLAAAAGPDTLPHLWGVACALCAGRG